MFNDSGWRQFFRAGRRASGARGRSMPGHQARWTFVLLLVSAVVVSCGGRHDGLAPGVPPRPARGTHPDTLALTADNFADTDGNRFRDTTSVIIYLFAENHPIPFVAEGSFTFLLETTNGQPIAEWRFDREQTAAALREFGPGPAYLFELSILKADAGIGTDRIADREGELVATFAPAAAKGTEEPRRVRRRGTPVQIGPTGRARSP